MIGNKSIPTSIRVLYLAVLVDGSDLGSADGTRPGAPTGIAVAVAPDAGSIVDGDGTP